MGGGRGDPWRPYLHLSPAARGAHRRSTGSEPNLDLAPLPFSLPSAALDEPSEQRCPLWPPGTGPGGGPPGRRGEEIKSLANNGGGRGGYGRSGWLPQTAGRAGPSPGCRALRALTRINYLPCHF